MLAQIPTDVPAAFFQHFMTALAWCLGVVIAALGGWASVLAIRNAQDKKTASNSHSSQPKNPAKRYNDEATSLRFGRIESRLDGHDSEIDAAWEEMKALREKNSERYTEIAVSLAEIKVHLGIRPEKK